jgi:O-antigen/teichoic acid export membrane protein
MGTPIDKALKSIFKGGVIVFVGSLLSKFISLAFRILVGRTGVESYGVISVMMAVFSTALLFSNLGVPNGIQRYASYYLERGEKESAIGSIHTGTIIVSVSSILTAATLFALAPFLSNQVFSNPNLILPIKLAAIAIPFRAYTAIFMHITNALGKMQYSTITDKIFINAAQLVLAFSLIYLGYGYLGAAFAYSVTFILGAFLSAYFAYRELPEAFQKVTSYWNFREIFHHSWPLILAGVFSRITGNIDTFMIQGFLSSTEVGLYQAAFPFGSALLIGSGMFSTIFLSDASKLISKGKEEQLARTYRTVVKWTSIITVPMFLVLFAFPKTVLILFGAEYYSAGNILRVVAVGFLISGLIGPAANIYQAIEKTKLNFYTSAILGILNLGLNFALIPVYGAIGAAWASTLSFGIVAIVNIYLVSRIIGKQPFRKSIIKVWISALIAIASVYYISNLLFEVAPVWFFIISLGFYGVIYTLALLLFDTIEEEDLMIMKAIRDKTGLELKRTEKIVRKLV